MISLIYKLRYRIEKKDFSNFSVTLYNKSIVDYMPESQTNFLLIPVKSHLFDACAN
jgi:hypothetical protein